MNPTGIESVVPRVILILRSEEIPFPSDRNSPSGFRRETSPLVELYFSGISIRKRVAASLRELVSTLLCATHNNIEKRTAVALQVTTDT